MAQPATGFDGFPAAAIQFFSNLKQNNDRDWFSDNKQAYQDAVIEPAKAFILSLGSRLSDLHPDIQFNTATNGSGSMFRIYRDVRFSQDKSPYKTHLGVVFWIGAGRKKTETPGYYFGLSDGPPQMHAGLHGFSKEQMHAYREALSDPQRADELAGIVATVRDKGYTVGGLHYKRVPRGFPPDHPHEELLRHNSLGASSPKIPLSVTKSNRLVDVCMEHCVALSPLNRWLLQLPG